MSVNKFEPVYVSSFGSLLLTELASHFEIIPKLKPHESPIHMRVLGDSNTSSCNTFSLHSFLSYPKNDSAHQDFLSVVSWDINYEQHSKYAIFFKENHPPIDLIYTVISIHSIISLILTIVYKISSQFWRSRHTSLNS